MSVVYVARLEIDTDDVVAMMVVFERVDLEGLPDLDSEGHSLGPKDVYECRAQ